MINKLPTMHAVYNIFSVRSTLMTARPTAEATGLPRYSCAFRESGKLRPMAAVVTTTPIGYPLPIGLPKTTMSGTTPSCIWYDQNPPLPHRPKPVFTSSTISNPPIFRTALTFHLKFHKFGDNYEKRENTTLILSLRNKKEKIKCQGNMKLQLKLPKTPELE